MSADRHRLYPPDFCTADTMAYLLELGVSTFHRYVAEGKLPPGIRIGGCRRWSRTRVLTFLETIAEGEEGRSGDELLEALRNGPQGRK